MTDTHNSSVTSGRVERKFSAGIRSRRLSRAVLVSLMRAQNPYKVSLDNSDAELPNKPVLFVSNHTNGQDYPTVAQALWQNFGRSFYTIAADDGTKGAMNRLAFDWGGVVWFQRGDPDESKKAVDQGSHGLRSGISHWMCPEAAWSPTPKFLPFHKGAIRIARKGEALITPLVIDYTEGSTRAAHVNVGRPFDPTKYSDEIIAVSALSEKMWEVRRDMWRKYHPEMPDISSPEAIEWWKSTRSDVWLPECPWLKPEKEITYVQGYGKPANFERDGQLRADFGLPPSER